MKCFTWKDKNKARKPNSGPVLNDQNKSENLAGERATKSSGSSTSITQLYQERAQSLRVFSFSELRKATKDFSRLLKIGEGGFGDVYKGSIKPVDGNGSPIVVAVKKLKRESHQDHKQWVAEVQFLGIVEHPNLVKLIGYCAADGERGINRLLVYEFMPNGSLADHLFGKAYPALPWQTRLQIVLGAAEGLVYLHEELEVQVIHRDFKSSNVLLDEDFKPKLSDFGLAREGPKVGQTHVSTAVLGTCGYAAPDYIETGRLTSKSDVWSFGVVLYEIITGKRSLDRNRPKSEQKLLDWVKQYPVDSKKFCKIMDQRLENNYSLTAARAIAKLANGCLLKSSRERPTMSEVVKSLTRILQVSSERSPPNQSIESLEDDETVYSSKKPNHIGPSETARMRMANLAKLSEHVDSKRKFMLMHRANLT